MNRLNRQQKDKITQFRSIVGASDKQAIDCLKQAGWSVEGGIEVFYSMGMRGTAVVDSRSIEQFYKKYKGKCTTEAAQQLPALGLRWHRTLAGSTPCTGQLQQLQAWVQAGRDHTVVILL
eukprot:GHRR01020533.1.p1 GENE.GHRR01020533.1~~GHRR01020533.1.p1  ORF type:complete len:120 (+),score=29.53 GHRR01020533.1:305-664(+)